MVRELIGRLILTTCLACSVVLFGQQSQQQKKTEEDVAVVELKFKDTPLVKYVNDTNLEKGDVKWLVVEVDFTPKEKKISKDKFAWIDDLVVEFEVLIPSTYNGKNVFALLSGQVSYWAVPLDGRKHLIEGFVPPQIVERYLRPGIKANKKGLETSIGARVSFYTKNKRLLGRYYSTLKGEGDEKLEKVFDRASDTVEGGVIYIKDAVYSRNNTPWQFINFGTYDLEKKNEKQP